MKFLSCILIHEGVITREQLVNALEQQILTGGDLTNIYQEFGYLTEEQLLPYLEKRYRIKSKKRDDFAACQAALSRFPEFLIWKYHVFPLEWQRSTLHLGMVAPNDRLAQISIANMVHSMTRAYVISRSTWDYLIQRYLSCPAGKKERAAFSGGPLSQQSLLEWAKGQLLAADSAASVNAVLLQYLSRCYRRGAIFLVRQGQITLKNSFGFPEEQLVEDLHLPLAASPGLANIVNSGIPFVGQLSDDSWLPFLERLGLDNQVQQCVIIPLMMGGRVVQLYYLDNNQSRNTAAVKIGEVSIILNQAAKIYEDLLRKTVEEHTNEAKNLR